MRSKLVQACQVSLDYFQLFLVDGAAQPGLHRRKQPGPVRSAVFRCLPDQLVIRQVVRQSLARFGFRGMPLKEEIRLKAQYTCH